MHFSFICLLITWVPFPATEPSVDDFCTCQGVVLNRAATILRFIETHPLSGGSTNTCIYIFIYIYIYMYYTLYDCAYIHTYIYIYIYTLTHTCTHTLKLKVQVGRCSITYAAWYLQDGPLSLHLTHLNGLYSKSTSKLSSRWDAT